MNLQQALQAVLAGRHLSREQARTVFADALHAHADPVQLAGLLVALAQRGESVPEITGAADALRAAMEPFEHDRPAAVDTCGTGGDGLGSFNLSTAAALVACAAGATVIKHGNRSVSSRCGSADLLEAAGVALELDPAQARAVLAEEGITYLHAPVFHPAMRFAAPVRRALGVRTIFNLLGPLCNPGRVRRHLLGVSAIRLVDVFAQSMAELGYERGYVVHGAGGADELTLAGDNLARAVGDAAPQRFDAAALGLEGAPVQALAGGDAQRNTELLAAVLRGARGPLRDAILLNAAATLVAAGIEDHASAALARATEALEDGRAARKLDTWAAATRKAAARSAPAAREGGR